MVKRLPVAAFRNRWLAGRARSHVILPPSQNGYVVVPAKCADLIEPHLLEVREAERARRKAMVSARYRGGAHEGVVRRP